MDYRISFTLDGAFPLIMCHDNILGADEVKEWSKDPENKNISVAGDDRSPPWTWQTRLYSDGQHITIPSENLMACLRQAGARKIMQRQKTYKEVTQTGIVIESEFMTLTAGDPLKQIPIESVLRLRDKPFKDQAEAVKKLGFELFMKRVGVNKSKHVRVRPRFNYWRVEGTAIVTARELTIEVLKEVFVIAGRLGLCDWRPGGKTPGPYGQFDPKIKTL